MSQVYSFSVKSKEDQEMVEALKLAEARKGVTWSHVIIAAIKREVEARKAHANK